MKKIVFLTGNSHKASEAAAILNPLGFQVEQMNADLPEIQDLSLEKVIQEKAKHARLFVPTDAVIIEDTAFYLDAYNNFPGPFGKYVIKGIGFSGILKLVENMDKSAHFRALIAYIPEYAEKPVFFEGICKGQIMKASLQAPVDMPYDAIFAPEGYDKTFLELPISVKDKVSHRARALNALATYLKEGKSL